MTTNRPTEKRTFAILLGIVVAWCAVMVLLQWLRYQSFFHYEYEDDALYAQLLDNIGRGQWFVNSIHPVHRPTHLLPILILIWPLYALLGGGWTAVFVIKALFIGSGALAVYQISRTLGLSKSQGLTWSSLYLAFPPVIALVLSTFRPLSLSVGPIMFMLWAFMDRRFKETLLLAGFVLMFREDLGLTVMLLSAVAFARKYPKKWIIWPLVMGAGWLVFVTLAVLPGGYTDIIVGTNVAEGGHWTDKLKQITAKSHWLALGCLLLPLALLPLGAWESLLGLVGVASICLNRREFVGNLTHLGTPAIAALFVGALVTFARHHATKPWLLPVVTALMLIAHSQPWLPPTFTQTRHSQLDAHLEEADFSNAWSPFDSSYYQQSNLDTVRWEAVRTVPEGSKVTVSGHFLPAFAQEAKVYEFGHWESPWRSADWLVVEPRYLFNGAGGYITYPDSDMAKQLAPFRRTHKIVFDKQGIQVWKRFRVQEQMGR